MSDPDYSSVLHLSDPAFTATLLSRAADETGRHWRVLALAIAPPGSGPAAIAAKALRGLRWESQLAVARAQSQRVHVHSVLAQRHAGWAFGRRFALHLHGTDIRTNQYLDQHRDLVRETVRRAQTVFYSTPDLREHVSPLRDDARLVPVPVPVPLEFTQVRPTKISEMIGSRDYIFFPSRWEEVKGGQRQIEVARALSRALSDASSPVLVGLDWGPLAQEASAAGVRLVPKMPHREFRAAVAGARLCVGQFAGILSASELDALAADVPLVAPLNPGWYDGSHSSLVTPPVMGGVDLGMTGGPADVVDLVIEELNDPALRLTASWVEEHHSPQAALSEVLSGYRETGW
ncbi:MULTISPECIES: hypothetical protein [unclassified Brachybacterium]|uniref:hypothetical protein n=1 Tax=unclassified Brachybacterium TaxID=2623841 RepID=UPI00402AC257